jgi:hypothetical protein
MSQVGWSRIALRLAWNLKFRDYLFLEFSILYFQAMVALRQLGVPCDDLEGSRCKTLNSQASQKERNSGMSTIC